MLNLYPALATKKYYTSTLFSSSLNYHQMRYLRIRHIIDFSVLHSELECNIEYVLNTTGQSYNNDTVKQIRQISFKEYRGTTNYHTTKY